MASPSRDRLQPVLTNQQREQGRPLAAALALPMGVAVEVKPREPRGAQEMKPATKDVARAFLRAVSPFVATCPAAHDGTRAPSNPTSKQRSRAPNLPQPVLPSGNKTTKPARKPTNLTPFCQPPTPPPLKKSLKTKTLQIEPDHQPPKSPKSPIYLPKPAILCHFIKRFYAPSRNPL